MGRPPVFLLAAKPPSPASNTANAIRAGNDSVGIGVVVVVVVVALVCEEKSVGVVVPSRFTSTRSANPLGSPVSAGTLPAASENMLKAKLVPEVDTPSGELNAGPNRAILKERVEPNLKPRK